MQPVIRRATKSNPGEAGHFACGGSPETTLTPVGGGEALVKPRNKKGERLIRLGVCDVRKFLLRSVWVLLPQVVQVGGLIVLRRIQHSHT